MQSKLNKQDLSIDNITISLLVVLFLTACAATHPSKKSDVKPYISKSYNFHSIDNILIYSDFALTREGFATYMHRGLEERFSQRGIDASSYIEHVTMNETSAFKEAESRHINFVLVLKKVREEAYPTIRVSLYETKTKEPLLRCIVTDTGFSWISIHETYNRLIDGVMDGLEVKE